MALKIRTVLAFLLLFAIALTLVRLELFQWAFVVLSTVFLFVSSVMFAGYLKFARQEKKLLSKLPTASVLIPCYNREDSIEECIKSVKAMKYPQKFDIIVVDDASTDRSYSILEKIPGIKVLRQPENRGKAAALNKALNVSKAELVACVDADTFPTKPALQRMASRFTSKKVGAVTALIKPSRTRNLLEKAQEIEYLIGFGFSQSAMSGVNSIIVTPGPMAVYRRKLLIELGGYDETNQTEDMEIALRIRKNLYNIVACPEALVYTDVPSKWRSWLRQRRRWYRGKIFNTWKYKDLVFRPKYGEVSHFGLPLTFLLEMSAIFMLFLIISVSLDSALYTLGFAISSFKANFFSFQFPPLIFNSATVYVNPIILGNFALGIAVSHKLAHERITFSKLPGIVFIVFAYSLVISSIWLISLFEEINKSSSQW